MRGNHCAPRKSSNKKLGAPLTRGAFTYLSTDSVFSVDSATAFVPVLFSSLAAAAVAVELMMKKSVLVVATWRKWSGKWSNNGLYNYWAVFTD